MCDWDRPWPYILSQWNPKLFKVKFKLAASDLGKSYQCLERKNGKIHQILARIALHRNMYHDVICRTSSLTTSSITLHHFRWQAFSQIPCFLPLHLMAIWSNFAPEIHLRYTLSFTAQAVLPPHQSLSIILSDSLSHKCSAFCHYTWWLDGLLCTWITPEIANLLKLQLTTKYVATLLDATLPQYSNSTVMLLLILLQRIILALLHLLPHQLTTNSRLLLHYTPSNVQQQSLVTVSLILFSASPLHLLHLLHLLHHKIQGFATFLLQHSNTA